ncbi:unnamed protein product [Zymoseptoria tritici ST99CH_1E4]|uniref:Secreted protein n=2 Tax=Zymoseptoria tritici TaxID=1047171 RepID=F9XPD9_ZYMTI|nr:uncharacterized protein MYCGRDRAFT_96887 [Zymoseptoria tritici IPO323]EGP83220.1 hypothetical protein MYCGRDRAFT_96887 [Zymoseptoria tritici IPO323]SMR60735.1 unnamed protein product [Zymoseptoria tritici ST99CH_1E4]
MHFTTTVLAAVLLSYHQTLGSALPAAPNPAASVLDEAIATAEAQASNVAAFIQGVSAGLKPTTQPAKPTQTPQPKPKPMCDYLFTSVHQYGGGSPYQAAIDRRIICFQINDAATGKTRYDKDLNWDNEYAFSVGRADHEGTHNMWARGAYEGLTDSWPACAVSFDGGEFVKGTGGQDTDIDSGIVSVTTPKCTARHEC